jgi:Flp pilus assembly protein TadD
MTSKLAWSLLAATIVLAELSPGSATAGLLRRSPAPAAASRANPGVSEIRRALDEQRLLDAARLIEAAVMSGEKDPRIPVLTGELNLARGKYEEALAVFKAAEALDPVRGEALVGEGLALSLLKRSDEALATLKQAVAAKPDAWRAWNALGSEYDARQDWPEAEAAYERAISGSNRAPIALNNRGFSRLLQGKTDDAVKDFVEALGKKPDLAAARTNLRLAMAMRGEYDRAVAGAPQETEAASLNNAGFAAMMRGDYAAAEDLFDRAMRARGQYYARAAENLQLARSLKAQTQQNAKAGDHAP